MNLPRKSVWAAFASRGDGDWRSIENPCGPARESPFENRPFGPSRTNRVCQASRDAREREDVAGRCHDGDRVRVGQRSCTNDRQVARRDTPGIHVLHGTFGGAVPFSVRLEVSLTALVVIPLSLAACNLPGNGIGFDQASASASLWYLRSFSRQVRWRLGRSPSSLQRGT